MKKLAQLFVLLLLLFFEVLGVQAQKGLIVYGRDTLCFTTSKIQGILHEEPDMNLISIVCQDTTIVRDLSEIDSIGIERIPDCLIMKENIGDWTDMRISKDGSVALTKMKDDDTPIEINMMTPNDSLGTIFTKIVFDDDAYPVEITINDCNLLISWINDKIINLTIVYSDSIAVKYDSIHINEPNIAAVRTMHVPVVNEKPWVVRLGGLIEAVGGVGSMVVGGVMVFASGAAEVFTDGLSTPFSVPAAAIGLYTVNGGAQAVGRGLVNLFHPTVTIASWDQPMATVVSQEASQVLQRTPNYITNYLDDLGLNYNQDYLNMPQIPGWIARADFVSALASIIGQATSYLGSFGAYTKFDLIQEVQNNVYTGVVKDITSNSAIIRGYIGPYILESPNGRFDTEYGIVVYSSKDGKDRHIYNKGNEEFRAGGMIEHIFNDLKPGTTYKYCTYYIDRTNGVSALGEEKTFTTNKVFPVKITDFKVTKSQYKKDAFTHEGNQYDYRYDVSVTATLDEDAEDIADWGYMYQDPFGNPPAKISLKEFGSSYTDTRWAYFRNENPSTCTLYGYVKYVDSDAPVYGEPHDYPLEYTNSELKITTGGFSNVTQNSAIVSGIFENVPEGAICGVEYTCNDGKAEKRANTTPNGEYSFALSSLKPNTTYTYRAFVEIDGKYYYANESKQFKTEGGGETFCPDSNHPHWIDLGLPSGTQWRCCNEGASAPEAYGGYYAFGQVSSAPTEEQIQELLGYCSYEWTTLNGVYGGKFTGPNGGTIFLPAAGYRWGGEFYGVGSYGLYWSSPPYDEGSVFELYFSPYEAGWNGIWDPYSRLGEISLRPVR